MLRVWEIYALENELGCSLHCVFIVQTINFLYTQHGMFEAPEIYSSLSRSGSVCGYVV